MIGKLLTLGCALLFSSFLAAMEKDNSWRQEIARIFNQDTEGILRLLILDMLRNQGVDTSAVEERYAREVEELKKDREAEAEQNARGTAWQQDVTRMRNILLQNSENATLSVNSTLIAALHQLHIDSSVAEAMKSAQEEEEGDELLISQYGSRDLVPLYPSEIRDIRIMLPLPEHLVLNELCGIIASTTETNIMECPIFAHQSKFAVSRATAELLSGHHLTVLCLLPDGSYTLAGTRSELPDREQVTFCPLFLHSLEAGVVPPEHEFVIPIRLTKQCETDEPTKETERPKGGGITKISFLPIPTLRHVWSAISQLSEVMNRKHKVLLGHQSLMKSTVGKLIKHVLVKGEALWSFFMSESVHFYSNLATVFVFYHFLGEQHDEGEDRSEEELIERTMLFGLNENAAQLYASLCHEEKLIRDWVMAQLRPYVSLFAQLNGHDYSLYHEDNHSINHLDLERLFESYAREYQNAGRRRARRLKGQARRELEGSRQTPTLDLTAWSEDLESKSKTKKKGKEKETKKPQVLNWKERVAEIRKASEQRKADARNEIGNEHRNNQIGMPQVIEGSSQNNESGIMALWPSERDRLAKLLENEFRNNRVYNAFIDPFDKRYRVTQEEINEFFEKVGDKVAAFLVEDGRYSKEAIEEFVAEFVELSQGTDHTFHGSSHTGALPASYVAHRRIMLILFGIMPLGIFKHEGRDGREAEQNYLMRLLHNPKP